MDRMTTLPGLTDAHIHLKYYALSQQTTDRETDTLIECSRCVEERIQAVRMEDRFGKLAPGYLANLIVFAQNPFVTPPADLLEMESSARMTGDEWVW